MVLWTDPNETFALFLDDYYKKKAVAAVKYIRFFWSGCLSIFSVFIVFYGILAGESSFALSFSFLPAWFGFILLFIMLGLLLLLEGVLVSFDIILIPKGCCCGLE